MIHRRDEPLQHVFFPTQSVVWLTCTTTAGASSQLAMIGSEGFVGMEVLLGSRSALCDATLHDADDAVGYAMTVDAFSRELDQRGALYDLTQRYSAALVNALAQSVGCNAWHSGAQRCCRWLLEAERRFGRSSLSVTHEALSDLLGLRRPTVTILLQQLQRDDIISMSRGWVHIVDRPSLEQRACACVKTSNALWAAGEQRGVVAVA
jgi:CRP-like cAMP-binding protein